MAKQFGGRVGGSFAPPLSDEKIAQYDSLIEGLKPSPIKDAMTELMSCCKKWWDLPEPQGTMKAVHPSSVDRKDKNGNPAPIFVTELQRDHAQELDELIPWSHQIEGYKKLFDTIPNDSQKELRDAAHHLLWHVIELDLGREPTTNDKF